MFRVYLGCGVFVVLCFISFVGIKVVDVGILGFCICFNKMCVSF